MNRYRGFAGQVAPFSGLGWLERSSWDKSLDTARFPGAKSFCGRADYAAYVAEFGAPPAGSAIYGTGGSSPEFCRAPTAAPVMPEASPPVVTYDPDPVADSIYRDPRATVALRPRLTEEGAAQAEAMRARAQELETRQAIEGGDGVVPELEARARVQEATRQVIENGSEAPGAVPEKKPNWLPLIVGAVAIYLMQ